MREQINMIDGDWKFSFKSMLFPISITMFICIIFGEIITDRANDSNDEVMEEHIISIFFENEVPVILHLRPKSRGE